jgi:hypothetical protein
MNNPHIPSIARQQLPDAISKSQPATYDPLSVSPWIAMSLLQTPLARAKKFCARALPEGSETLRQLLS